MLECAVEVAQERVVEESDLVEKLAVPFPCSIGRVGCGLDDGVSEG